MLDLLRTLLFPFVFTKQFHDCMTSRQWGTTLNLRGVNSLGLGFLFCLNDYFHWQNIFTPWFGRKPVEASSSAFCPIRVHLTVRGSNICLEIIKRTFHSPICCRAAPISAHFPKGRPWCCWGSAPGTCQSPKTSAIYQVFNSACARLHAHVCVSALQRGQKKKARFQNAPKNGHIFYPYN